VKLLSLFLRRYLSLFQYLQRCFSSSSPLFAPKKEKKSSSLPTFQKPQKKRAKKVKNVSQFERWSDDSHAIERTRDVENTRQENSKVNPFARCIERDRG